MALTFSSTQAIKFLQNGEASFNSSEICSCGPEGAEQWSYAVTAGDTIDFQILSNCELSDDFILNGSFEDGTGSDFTASDWTRAVSSAENTNVTRIASNAAQCGQYLAYWENEASTPNAASITQTYAAGFTTGQVYKFTIKAKLTEASSPTNSNANILKLTIGGKIYYITPTTSWADYTITVLFATAAANDDIKIEINTASAANITEMFVDCVTMQEYEGCCIRQLINNGDFESGQPLDGDIVATADNWTVSGGLVLDTGGRDGGRGVLLDGLGDTLTQEDVLLENTSHIVTFWAKADVLPCAVSVYAGATSIGSVLLTLDWAEYSLTFYNLTEDDLIFTQEENNNDIYIDDVAIVSVPLLGIYINDLESTDSIPVSATNITAYPDHINVSIPVDEYDMPSCFNICVEPCLENLVDNGNFEQGSGDTFTSWTQTLAGGTITEAKRTNRVLWSNDFSNAVWVTNDLTATAGGLITTTGTGAPTLIAQNSAGGFVAGTIYTYSVYAKQGTARFIQLLFSLGQATSNAYANFDLQLGTFSLGAGLSADIELQDDGYYRCSITYLSAVTGSNDPTLFLVDSLAAARVASFSGAIGSTLEIKQQQQEPGDYASEYILTAGTVVTVNDGIGGSRAVRINSAGGGTSIAQTVLTVGQTYRVGFWAKRYLATPILLFQGENITVDQEDWTYYELDFTAISTPVSFEVDNANASVGIDDVIVVSTPTDAVCSESFKYTDQLDSCMPELTWYDNNEEAMGIIYSTGFRNHMRVKGQLQSPQYIKEEFTASFSSNQISINSFTMRKTNELAIDNVPEFIVDRLALMAGVSNIEYGTTLLRPASETEVSTTYDRNSRTMGVTIVLSPQSEYLGNRQYNCS